MAFSSVRSSTTMLTVQMSKQSVVQVKICVQLLKHLTILMQQLEKNVKLFLWMLKPCIPVGKYLAVMMTQEEIEEEGLSHVVPKRRGIRQRRITINYLQHKKNKDKWLPARYPGVRQKRKMLSLAVSFGVNTALSNHTYCVGDQSYLQMSGGPIGLQLTGAVSRAFMMRWDRMYLTKVKRSGLKMQLYERFIDDSNQTAEVPPPGAIFNKERQRVEINEMLANDDDDTEERLGRVLKTIANDVNRDIVMVEDYPSKNENGKMAVLERNVYGRMRTISSCMHIMKNPCHAEQSCMQSQQYPHHAKRVCTVYCC